MLELVLVAFVQLNTLFGDVNTSTSASIESGGNGWGDTHVELSSSDSTAYSGGNGWGDTH